MKMKINIKKFIGDIPKRAVIYILGAVGILLLILPSFAPKEAEEPKETEIKEDYAALLEKRLEDILPGIEGVGRVRVMITAKNYGEIRLAKDEDDSGKKTVILNKKGGGEETEIIEESYPDIEGVVIAAQGGASAVVKENLTEAVGALLGIEAHKIKVFKMADDF